MRGAMTMPLLMMMVIFVTLHLKTVAPVPTGQDSIARDHDDSSFGHARVRRIINGGKASRCHIPYLASLWYWPDNQFHSNTSIKHVCTGALIHPQWILIAAHCCVKVEAFNEITVKLGVYDQRARGRHEQHFDVTQIVLAENYDDDTLYNDICLMKLDRPVNENRWVKPWTDLDDGTCTSAGTTCTVTAWGHTEPKEIDGTGASALPYTAEVSLTNTDDCVNKWQFFTAFGNNFSYVIDPPTQVCGIGEVHNNGIMETICFGDSGAALFCECQDGKQRLAGIASITPLCGHVTDVPAVFTRVSAYVGPFINIHLQSDEASVP